MGDLYSTDDIYGELNEAMVQALIQQDEQFQQEQEYEQHMISQQVFNQGNEIYQQSIQIEHEGEPQEEESN